MTTHSHRLAALAASLLLLCPALPAASTTTLSAGLLAPTKVAFSSKGNLLIAEAGFGANTGRISLVDPATGARRTLVAGLPSGLAAPNNDPSGPSGLLMRGRTLYLTIGSGNSVINGGAPGTTVPNPHPSSPLFASVLAIHFSANVENTTQGFTLAPSDHTALKNGSLLGFDDGAGEKTTIEVVADFDDYSAEPRPDEPNHVRPANPFGIAVVGERLWVVDASANAVRTVDLASNKIGVLSTFSPLPNTRGFGPPVVEAVPDSIRVFGNQFLVALLTGFPFPVGAAQVRTVDADTGTNAPLLTGLTSAIDVLPIGGGGFLTLEFSADILAGPLPGRLQWFATSSAAPVVITAGLITPTSMVRDDKSGALFITEIFTGRVIKVSP